MNNVDKLFLASGGMIKEALIGDNLNKALGGGFLGNAAEIGTSMLPGVGAIDSAHYAGKNMMEGFGRLGQGDFGGALRSGAKFLGNSAMAGLSFLPGGGALGGLAKGIGKGLMRFAPKAIPKSFNAIGRSVPTLSGMARRGYSGMQHGFANTGVGKTLAANPGKAMAGFMGANLLDAHAEMGHQQSSELGSHMGDFFNEMRQHHDYSPNPMFQAPSPMPTYMGGLME